MLIALFSGAVFSFALAPYYWWWLAILSPALLYATLHNRSAKQAFAIGWSYGFGLWFVGAFWLYTSIHVYGDTNAFLSVCMIAVMALVMGLFTAFQTWIYRRFFPETPLTFAPLWIILSGLKLGYLPVSLAICRLRFLLNVYSMVMRRYLVFMQFPL